MNFKQAYSLKDLILYFLKLGSIGFGVPVALVGYMYKDLVEEKKWITEDEYKEGLALSQLAPGPLASQLAIYIGYIDYRLIGATLAGLAFVIPSFFMVLGIGFAYVKFGSLPWMQSVFYGVGAAVIGIIAVSSYKLTVKNIAKDYLLWGIFITLAITTFIFESENIWLIISSGILVWLIKTPPTFLKTTHSFIIFPTLIFATTSILLTERLEQIAWFFAKAGTFVFGSGLAIIPFLYSGVVKEYHWLTEQQFLDAIAVAMITPGPVVITVGFIGYLVAGFSGASVASLATFMPCYLFTILPAPYFKKYGKNPAIKSVVEGITVAAIGAIVGAVILLAKKQFTDLSSILIAMITIIVLLKFQKIKEPIVILIAAIIGMILKN